MTKVKRASDKRLLEFTNEVRACGGAEVQQALMPGTPQDQYTCLVANNLNFKCRINCFTNSKSVSKRWYMAIPKGAKIINKLVKELGLTKRGQSSVWLPADIGQAADDFDKAAVFCYRFGTWRASPGQYATLKAMWKYLPDSDKDRLSMKFKTKNGNLIEYSKLPPAHKSHVKF